MDRKIKPPDKERKLNDMLAKSCQWWLIWYLLFFYHGGAEDQLQWVVKEKVTDYGQNLTLFCPVENCCSEPAGWSFGTKSIILDVKTFLNDPNMKYIGTYNTDGFGVVIRNLSEADLNVTYHCVYGFDESTPKYLLHGDVFRENVPDKDKENDTTAAIVVPIVVTVVVIALIIIGIVAYCVYRSRIKKKRQKQIGTDEEMEDLNPSDSQMKNQQDKAEALSQKENNFFRLYFLCKKIGTQAVRFFFDSNVHTLESFLNEHKSNLTFSGNCYRCTMQQEAKLFPGGQVVVVSTDFDFTLLYKLIRNLLTAIPAPTCGWGNRPLPGHLNETDDIERIRYLRNNLAHNSDFEICNTDFSTHWTDLSQAIDRLSKGSLSTDVESMRTKQFDKCIINEMEEDIQKEEKKTQEEFMSECSTDIADNKQKIYDIDDRHIPLNIQNEADCLSKGGNNFIRLNLLCQKIGTQAVRGFFDSKVPGHTLESFLKQHKSNLTSPMSAYRCTKNQELKLFPGGQVAVASADFNFTLLYKLIRNLLTAIPPPTCGWGNQPLPGHLNEADDIERIRHLRNDLANHSDLEICDTDFSTHWTDLSQAINRLSKGSLSTEVESLRTKSFDIRKGHFELIKKWRLEDKLFYDENGGFIAAWKMVQSKNYMTIIGGPGSGKTATARHIALQLEEQGWEVVPVCRLEEIIQYGDRDHKQVFVLDDVLGIFAVDFYNYIINHEENIVTAIGKTSKLLFTCRKSVYKEALKLELFITKNIVDLQSEDNQLTETEKMAIFQYHCKSKGVNPDLYTSLSFTKANHMFPLLCKLFSMEEQYQRLGEKFFNKPFKYFIKELDKLQRTNTIQYAVLVLCLVNKGKLSLELLPHKHMQEEVFDYCGVNLGTPVKEIKDAIYHMSDTYFTKLDTEYTFTYDFIFEAIAYHYGHENKHQILKHLSSCYIANKVTVYEQASNEDLCIHISEDMYLPLAERLYKDIQSMNLFDVFMNKSLKHGPFLDVFEGMLKIKPFDEFESLILRKRENFPHFVQKTFSSNDDLNVTKLMRLYLLSDIEFSEKSYLKHSVRVISWIINYGHTHLLKEIVKHVECNKHNISLIFGSNVIENMRLLLLGCYSDTLDMVELILKYVDPKCIDMECGASSSLDHNVQRFHTPLIVACTTGNLSIVTALLRNKRTNGNKILEDSNALHNPYPEEKVNRSKEEQEKEKEGETTFTREQEEKEEIIYTRETKEENEKAIARRKEQIEKVVLGNTRKEEDKQVNHLGTYSITLDALLPDYGNMTPLSVAVEYGHIDIVKYILENITDFDLSKIGKLPLFLAAEKGYHDIIDLLLHSEYNDITQTYLDTTPLEIALWRNNTKVVQLLIQEENKLQKYQGNYHLFKILVDLKRSTFCIDEGTDMLYCHVKDRNHHLPHSLWRIITVSDNDYLTHLLQIGLDINKRNYKGDTLLYRILNKMGVNDKFKSLMEHFEDVNAGETKWISLLKDMREDIRRTQDLWKNIFPRISDLHNVRHKNDILSECRRHIRRHSFSGISDLHNVRHAKSAQTNGFPC